MSKLVRLVVAKGKSVPSDPKDPSSPSLKRFYQIKIEFPEGATEETLQESRLRGEMKIDNWLEEAPTHVPELDPKELMEHPWKGRKTGDGQHAKGSTSWGWDFKDQFSEEVLKALEKGPITINDCQFTLGETIVQAKKRKG